jgi:hypothetical protein
MSEWFCRIIQYISCNSSLGPPSQTQFFLGWIGHTYAWLGYYYHSDLVIYPIWWFLSSSPWSMCPNYEFIAESAISIMKLCPNHNNIPDAAINIIPTQLFISFGSESVILILETLKCTYTVCIWTILPNHTVYCWQQFTRVPDWIWKPVQTKFLAPRFSAPSFLAPSRPTNHQSVPFFTIRKPENLHTQYIFEPFCQIIQCIDWQQFMWVSDWI